jgi:hypothetical protein
MTSKILLALGNGLLLGHPDYTDALSLSLSLSLSECGEETMIIK